MLVTLILRENRLENKCYGDFGVGFSQDMIGGSRRRWWEPHLNIKRFKFVENLSSISLRQIGIYLTKALPFGEGAPVGGGRGCVIKAFFNADFRRIRTAGSLFRHGYAVPPSPKGKALMRCKLLVKFKFV